MRAPPVINAWIWLSASLDLFEGLLGRYNSPEAREHISTAKADLIYTFGGIFVKKAGKIQISIFGGLAGTCF